MFLTQLPSKLQHYNLYGVKKRGKLNIKICTRSRNHISIRLSTHMQLNEGKWKNTLAFFFSRGLSASGDDRLIRLRRVVGIVVKFLLTQPFRGKS